jgi:hypothetical protein
MKSASKNPGTTSFVLGHDLGRLEKGSPAAISLHAAIRKLIPVEEKTTAAIAH